MVAPGREGGGGGRRRGGLPRLRVPGRGGGLRRRLGSRRGGPSSSGHSGCKPSGKQISVCSRVLYFLPSFGLFHVVLRGRFALQAVLTETAKSAGSSWRRGSLSRAFVLPAGLLRRCCPWAPPRAWPPWGWRPSPPS